MSKSLRLITLGTPGVWLDGEELTTFARKPLRAALLYYLGFERRTTRSAVIALMWPDREEAKGRHALAQTIYELRQELGSGVVSTLGDHLHIEEDVRIDALEFEDAVTKEDVDGAMALYAGPFLDGVHLCETREFEGWVDSRRARLGRQYRIVQRNRVKSLVDERAFAEGLEAARHWVSVDPLEDEAQHALIELLCLNGERIEALERYETYRERLAEELDVEPLDETKELVRRIREGLAGGTSPFGVADAGGGTNPSPAGSGLAARTSSSLDARVQAGLGPDLDVVRRLSEGTMGPVFLAREPLLRRLVAVKVLDPERLGDEVSVRRFQREAESAARIQHPNVLTVHRVGRLPTGEPYLVMPHIGGGSLADRLAAVGPLETDQGRNVLLQVAKGLAAAHAIGVIHRDVRPANVLLDEEGSRFVLADFGIAAVLERGDSFDPRLTRPGDRVGSARYSSPEQLMDEPLTDRADIYGLGLLAFETLIGRTPFEEETEVGVVAAQLGRDPPALTELRAEVDSELSDLVGRCLRKTPEHRPSAADVISVLEAGR